MMIQSSSQMTEHEMITEAVRVMMSNGLGNQLVLPTHIATLFGVSEKEAEGILEELARRGWVSKIAVVQR